MFGLGGNDAIRLDETNGPLPAAQMFGGSGNDTLTGGSGADALHGQDGNDTCQRRGRGGLPARPVGDDVIFGGDGADQMFGGSGDDTADGDRGDDDIFLGDGNDLFVWDPGDGSDRRRGRGRLRHHAVQGQRRRRGVRGVGQRRARPLHPRRRQHRDGRRAVERVDVEALGGHDTVTLNDLTGTAVQELRIDLEAVNGGAADDKNDRVILNGTGRRPTSSACSGSRATCSCSDCRRS